MPVSTADRTAADKLAIAHQKDVAGVAGGVASAVGSSALGADPTSISFWFQSALDAIMARIQAGYALNRRSAMGYLPQHGALNRVAVSPVPGSLDIGSTRARLQITGPVAFKKAIAAGAYQHEALQSMATQMSGVADELVRNGDRDVIVNTIRRGHGVVGYRRRLVGKSCGFCAMLASRGAVYSAETVGFRSHAHCRCFPEALYRHQMEPPEVQRLQRQWQRVTAGKSGSAAQREWRKHWEQRATPAARAREGIRELVPAPSLPAPSLPGGGTAAGAARPLEIRQVLLEARTASAVSRAFEAEAERITGRSAAGLQRIVADFQGSAATAREHAEGLLRGLERFPQARLRSVGTGRVKGSAYAEAGNERITFSYEWSTPEARKEYLDSLVFGSTRHEYGPGEFSSWHPVGTGNPAANALHEFGHTLDIDTLATRIASDVKALVRARAPLGAEEKLIRNEVSQYALTNTHELVAEAFSDVMVNGPAASRLSRDIFDLLEAEYRKGGYAMGPGKIGFSLPAPTGLSGKTVTELRALAKERGITGYSKLTKPQLLERLSGEVKAPATTDLTATLKRVNGIPAAAPRQIAAKVRAELQQQSELVPGALGSLQRIEIASDEEWARLVASGAADEKFWAGYQTRGERILLSPRWRTDAADLYPRLKRAFENADLAWSFPDFSLKNLDIAAGIVRHEFGHHVASAWPAAGAKWSAKQVSQLIEPLAKELGVAPPVGTDVAAWFARNDVNAAIRGKISRRAADGLDEMLAEVWAVYSGRGEAASALAKRVGAIMREAWASAETPIAKAVEGAAELSKLRVAFAERAGAALRGDALHEQIKLSLLRESGLTDSEIAAIRRYRGPEFGNINDRLWETKGRADFPTVREIDAAMSRSPLDREVFVLRGQRDANEFFGSRWSSDMSGFEWTEHGYLSTTTSDNLAKGFAHRRGADPTSGAVLKIVAPRGTHGIELSDLSGESEILFERGLKLRVVSDTGFGPGRVLEVEIVPSRGAQVARAAEGAADLSKLKVAELRALAKERDIAGYTKLTRRQLLEELRKPAPTPEDLLVTAARNRQAAIDYARARAELLSETEEWLNNQGSLATMSVQLRRDAKRFGIEGHKDVAALFKAIDAGDKTKVRRAIESVATKQKLTRVEKAGELVRYDRALHGDIGKDLKPGEWAIVVRPGYTFERNGEVIRLHKATVEKATAQEIAEAKVRTLPRIQGKAESPGATAKATNQSFGSTAHGPTYPAQGKAGQRWTPDLGPLPSGAYEENCTNVVNAWEMRMRGFDVKAAPLDVLDKYGYAAGRTFEETDELLAKAWRLPNGKPHGRTFFGRDAKGNFIQPWRSFADIDAEIERDWPEGGRGVITVGKHIFNVTKTKGKAQYIEAQYDANATRIVTRLYQKRFKAHLSFDGSFQEGKLIRLDDLVPAEDILQAVEAT